MEVLHPVLVPRLEIQPPSMVLAVTTREPTRLMRLPIFRPNTVIQEVLPELRLHFLLPDQVVVGVAMDQIVVQTPPLMPVSLLIRPMPAEEVYPLMEPPTPAPISRDLPLPPTIHTPTLIRLQNANSLVMVLMHGME